ncbi:MAG: acyl-CoA/acyl-ACP dehydrogenase [Deltaproteobacteria bacterium]|nr:acyl-CoA/acyl-ACP dehydrogenase [Deltaproteobacteria bacterium]
MEREALEAARGSAVRFARQEVAPLLAREGRDGDLTRLPGVLARAEAAGLLGQGEDAAFALWGSACEPLAAVVALEAVAEECAGVALCLHYAAVAQAVFSALGDEAEARGAGEGAVGLFAPPALGWPLAKGIRVRATGDEARVEGELCFVHGPPDAARYALFADDGFATAVVVRAGAEGLYEGATEEKVGLAALSTRGLRLEQVLALAVGPSPWPDAAGVLGRIWLGVAAAAVGNAQGALTAATRYASERYQGGGLIRDHAAVEELLAEAGSRVACARAFLYAAAERCPAGGLRELAQLKLRATLDAAQAVSDSLQVLGGYGYMEDYRLEKRLRDALALKVLAGRPADLRRATLSERT